MGQKGGFFKSFGLLEIEQVKSENYCSRNEHQSKNTLRLKLNVIMMMLLPFLIITVLVIVAILSVNIIVIVVCITMIIISFVVFFLLHLIPKARKIITKIKDISQ